MKYAIFATTTLQDCWIKDSVCESLAAMAEYIHKNRWKLDKITNLKSPGLQGDWGVYHYEPGKKLSELASIMTAGLSFRAILARCYWLHIYSPSLSYRSK